MMHRYTADHWANCVRLCADPKQRDQLLGVSITLAARLLRVSRSRVHQLVNSGKLAVVNVYDGGARIGHLVTLASIDRRRRTSKPRATQWRPERPRN